MAPDKHHLKPKAFRPEPDEYDQAKAVLAKEGREMDGFLRACLRLLHENPAALLALLGPHWPPVKPRGQPPKTPATPPVE